MTRRLLVLSLYGPDQAGTRLRACQHEGALRAAGVDVEYWSFLAGDDSARWFTETRRARRALLLLRAVLRLLLLPGCVRRADAVLVLREALPVASAAVERWAGRRRPLVWDVDDALWAEYPRLFATWVPGRLRRSPEKYRRLAGLADEVWAGSDHLAAWCREHASSVVVVPTVVEVPAEVAPVSRRRPTAGWVGSSSTALFLEERLPALAAVDGLAEVEVVGATAVQAPSGLAVRTAPWSTAAEEELLAGVRVGLYPLSPEHPLTEGKAGLKAVLYMAHGLPSVVTPTAATAALVRDGVDGVHARTPEEWQDAVGRLLADDATWTRMSAAAHARAAAELSAQVWGPRLAQRVLALLEER
jgi:hypothetical protein